MFTNPYAFHRFEDAIRRHTRYIHSAEIRQFLDAVVSTSKSRRRKVGKETILHRAQLAHDTRIEADGNIEIPCAVGPERYAPPPQLCNRGSDQPEGHSLSIPRVCA